MSHMIVQHEQSSSFLDRFLSQNSSSRHNKGDIINVTKVAARKSILMPTTKARVVNTYH
jgi:hypothetical protein